MSRLNQNTQTPDNGLVSIVETRQKRTLSRMPAYLQTSIVLAAGGFTLTFFVYLIDNIFIKKRSIPFSLSLGGLISLVLTLFVNVIIWLFVIWSLTIIPYIALHAYRSSLETKGTIRTKPFKWFQLAASTFLPMTIFAVAWNSLSTNRSIDIITSVSPSEFIFVLIGTALVAFLLFIINLQIPVNQVELRLAILSTMLYISLFLTYGLGYSPVSYAMVFGVLTYLSFGGGINSMGDMLKRFAIYDIDPTIADKLEDITKRDEERRVIEDEIQLQEVEYRVENERIQQKNRLERLKSDDILNQQLAKVRNEKIKIGQSVNEAQIQILEQRLQTLGKAFRILYAELNIRMDLQIQDRLQQLEQNTKNFSPTELNTEISELLVKMDESLEGIPESLEDLRNKLLVTAKAIETQTRLLISESERE